MRKTKSVLFFKVPISEILKQWREKGKITEAEITRKIKVTELTVISNVKFDKDKGKAPPEV